MAQFALASPTDHKRTGGWHVATYSGGASGTTLFDFADHLGTERVRATVSGSAWTAAETCTSLPFGDWLTCTGSDASPMHFTSQERDSESGNDNFGARYFGSSMGRFLSPDPSGIFLGNLGDPQQLNLYSYVRNNPINLTDPTGFDCQSVTSQDGMHVSANCVVNAGDNSCSLSDNWCQMQYQQLTGSSVTTSDILQGLRSQGQQSSQTPGSRLGCAATFGQNHSVGSWFGAQNNSVASLFGGNSVSGIVNIALSFGGKGRVPNFAGIVGGGASLGVPVNDALSLMGQRTVPGLTSATGTIRGVGLRGLFNTATEAGSIPSIAAEGGEIAMQGGLTAAEYASGGAIAKFVYDGLTFAYGYSFACGK